MSTPVRLSFPRTYDSARSSPIVGADATIALTIADVIDLDQERARISKDIAKAEAEMAKIDKKLNNPGFMAKAPDAVVEENRERRQAEVERRDRLAAALSRLEALR